MTEKPILFLGGATGSGKTALALKLAKRFPRLVLLSADSRQVYTHLDVGTGKVGQPQHVCDLTGEPESVWVSDGAPQYLIDIAEPNTMFTLQDYQREAYRLIQAAWQADKTPLLVGGTGLYLQAVVEGFTPVGEPNLTLRQELAGYSLEQLQLRLHQAGGTIVPSDQKNKRRLIRAIERASLGVSQIGKEPLTSNCHVFILDYPWLDQRERAARMAQDYLDRGLVAETQQLLASGVSRDWLYAIGLSYRVVIEVLETNISLENLPEKIEHVFRQLMRRQRTWFRRMPYAQLGSAEVIEEAIARLVN